jgi:hypothetical protein
VRNTDCVISSDRVWIVKSPSPVKSSSGTECMAVTTGEVFDTADGSKCEIVNCVSARANVQ